MLPLHAIERYCGTNPAGLDQIALIDPNDLLVQPKYHHIPSIQELQFKPGKAAFVLSHDMFTGILGDNHITDRFGDRYEYPLAFDVSKTRIEVDYLRAKLRNRRVHVLCTYNTGGKRYLPWMRLTSNGSSGNNSASNKYQFTGTCALVKPSPWIDAMVSVIGAPYEPPVTPGGGTTFDPVETNTTEPTYTYNMPAGKFLMAIFIKSTADQVVSIGYTAGGSELAGPEEMEAGVQHKFGDNWILSDAPIEIFFSGLQGTNNIQICVI